jgi:hypothetical protein
VRVEKLEGLVSRLHALPRRRLTLLVAVDGLPAAGKTTLARALEYLDRAIQVVETRGFPPPGPDGPEDEVAPGFDWRRLRGQLLLPLSRDLPGLAGGEELPVGGIVVVEGRGALIKQLATFYDFRVWVEAPAELRRRRLDGRAEGPAGGGEEERVRSAHLRVDGAAPVDPATQFVRLR